MSATPTKSLKGRRDDPAPSTTSSKSPFYSGTAELETKSDGEPKSTSLASDERVLRKLDELLGEVGDANERQRVILKAIEHLKKMQERLAQAV